MMELKGYAKLLKNIAGSQQSIIMVVIYFGMLLLEEFVVEDIFACHCEKGTGHEVAVIVLSTVIIMLFVFGLLQRAKLACFHGRNADYEADDKKENPAKSGDERDGQEDNPTQTRDDRDGQGDNPTQSRGKDSDYYCYHGCTGSGKDILMRAIWAIIGGVLWVTILCFDGDYIACADTERPYGDFNCSDFNINETPPFSEEYKKTRFASRIAATCIMGVGLLIFLIIFFICACCYGRNSGSSCNVTLCCEIMLRIKYSRILAGEEDRVTLDLLSDGQPIAEKVAKDVAQQVYNEGRKLLVPATEGSLVTNV